MEHNYHYDNLYRLDSASGAFVGANGKKANYSLAMGYDNMHNITHKRQDVVQQSVKFDGILNAGYDLSYTYANNSQQIVNIADASYRAERSSGMYATGSVASDSIDHKTHSYRYDANGNLLYVGTGKKINDSTLLESSTRRLLWDEDNRLLAISDNGYVSNYWYDASGERTVKQSGGSEGVFVNGVLSAARTQTSKFTAYVSPYLVVSNGGNYSKHIYVGSQRITSKLSNSLIFNESRNPLTITKANNSVEPVNATDYQAKFNTLTGTIAERFDSLGVIYKGTVQSGGLTTQGATSGVTPQYFYHPDHLGSSSLITDENGLMVQHIQYVPFGEVFVEERTTSWSTPYKFNAKELDPETGLYYYGARYYDPRTSVWLSVDPLAEKKPWMTSYHYCSNNPINRIDPDGKADFYSRIGIYLGNNGVDDKKIYLLNEGFRPRTENENINWGGKLDESASRQLISASSEVGGLIIQDRIEEGEDYTISEFRTVGGDENIVGFILEPEGPSTKESGKDKRIPEGVYNVESYSSKNYPENFVLYNEDVAKSRKILYHKGNNGSHTSGCNLPATTKGKGSVGRSGAKMEELSVFINSKGAGRIRTIITNKITNSK